MNIGDLSDDAMQKVFLLYCAKLMLQAKKKGQSMAILDVDPKVVFGIPANSNNADAGLLTIAVASGPSRPKLQQAIELVHTSH